MDGTAIWHALGVAVGLGAFFGCLVALLNAVLPRGRS